MKIIKGTLQVPGDKSISHRALIFAALCKGAVKIYGLSPAFDCIASADCLSQLGMSFERRSSSGNGSREPFLLVKSPFLDSLQKSDAPLFACNSGTTIRLLAGLLAGRPFVSVFDGDESLRSRPMARVLSRLQQMGCRINYLERENYPPFEIEGGGLKGASFALSEASAQVQTAVLLAGLQAEGKTELSLPHPVRDHTARMFSYIGVPFESEGPLHMAVSKLEKPLDPYVLEVPGDISSAAFFMVAAACLPGSELLLTNVSFNPGRTLVFDVLKELGADLEIVQSRICCAEPLADIFVRGRGKLSGAVEINGKRLAAGIDEIPILALAAALSEAELKVSDASELRVKESDRIKAIVSNLSAAGAKISENTDGFLVKGQGRLPGASVWHSFDDHRLAMTGLVAQLAAESAIEIDNESCVSVSYPDFVQDLKRLS